MRKLTIVNKRNTGEFIADVFLNSLIAIVIFLESIGIKLFRSICPKRYNHQVVSFISSQINRKMSFSKKQSTMTLIDYCKEVTMLNS